MGQSLVGRRLPCELVIASSAEVQLRTPGFTPMDLLTGVSWVYHHMFGADWS